MTEKPDQALQRVRRYQEILLDVSRMAGEARDLHRLLHLACTQAGRGLGIKHTKVLRYRADSGDLLTEAGTGWKPGVVGQVAFPVDVASPPGRCLLSRQTITVEDLPNASDFRQHPVLRDHGIVSLMNAPIVVDGTIWGVIELDSDTGRHFSQDDQTFLAALANILGIAIHRRQVEQATAEAAAQATLEMNYQQTLMRELLHRDKNDFQLIVSVLMAQKRKQQDPGVQRDFLHVMDRVAAISMAHDQLSATGSVGSIEISEYLQALCGSLDKRREDVRVEAALERATIVHERAVPLGLITNELVTNSIKHAFPDRAGTIRVAFHADQGGGEGCLMVADDGIGMEPSQASGSGLDLVKGLTRQIGGRMEIETSDRGTSLRIFFPLVS